MEVFRRDHAPLSAKAWAAIEEEAAGVLRSNLSARRVVDFDGPHGFSYSAVNLGRLGEVENRDGVGFGLRSVQPLTEVRVGFELDAWELDNLERGADAVDLESVAEAALKLARFEERAIYSGFDAGCIKGLQHAVSHEPVSLGADASSYPEAAARAMMMLSDNGVAGPYALVLGPEPFRRLSGNVGSYPPRQRVAKLLDGPVLYSPVLEGGFLVSLRGGDFVLTVGTDAVIGFESREGQKLRLFLTETFTFRVLDPGAAVPLKVG